MAQKPFFILFCVIISHSLFAQDLKTFKVNPGEKVYDVITPANRYTFTDFQIGQVFFRNNAVGTARMNYNALLASVEFIDNKGDTLALDNLESIRHITIAADTFYYDKVFVEKLATKGNIRLGRFWIIMLSNHQRLGSMGQPTDASVDAYTSLSSSGNALKTMVAKEILTYKEHIRYYFGDKFGQFRLANRKNLLAVFGNNKNQISSYLEEDKVDFLREADMLKLLDFLASL
jgi:hypothetical protein